MSPKLHSLLNPDAPAFLPLFEPAANAIAMTVRINGKKVYVRVVEEMKGDSHERYTQRHLELKAMSRSKQFAVDLLSKAYLHHMESLKSVTTVRTTKTFGTQVRWVEAQTRPSRPMDTIIFNGNEGQILLDDVSDFLASEAFYVARGLAYRRGYLAYGPPGCGKSSFVLALAGSLKLPVCVMNLSDPALTDSTLIDLLSTAPSPSIVLLEDIDAAFTKSKSTGGDDPEPDSGRGGGPNRSMQSKSLTFSGLLNALDGAAAQEGKVCSCLSVCLPACLCVWLCACVCLCMRVRVCVSACVRGVSCFVFTASTCATAPFFLLNRRWCSCRPTTLSSWTPPLFAPDASTSRSGSVVRRLTQPAGCSSGFTSAALRRTMWTTCPSSLPATSPTASTAWRRFRVC